MVFPVGEIPDVVGAHVSSQIAVRVSIKAVPEYERVVSGETHGKQYAAVLLAFLLKCQALHHDG